MHLAYSSLPCCLIEEIVVKRPILISTAMALLLCSTVDAKDPLKPLDYFVGSWIWEGKNELEGEPPEDFVWDMIADGRWTIAS
jgi:hypothetical protein